MKIKAIILLEKGKPKICKCHPSGKPAYGIYKKRINNISYQQVECTIEYK